MAIIPADEKVFMVDKRTNTTYGGSQALQDMQQWYTMQDVSDSVGGAILPYKVFTALLTQSGGSSISFISGGPLLVGQTYTIDNAIGNFTNVGAPNNDFGTSFIATGTTPASWSGGNLSYNGGAPVATVLENTIGNVWFEYASTGQYQLKSTLLFTEKTFIPNGTSNGRTIFNPTVIEDGSGIADGVGYFILKSDNNTIWVRTLAGPEVFDNDRLYVTPIEIRVYN
jgi:hypothetical protein